jgi:hypothetical protein
MFFFSIECLTECTTDGFIEVHFIILLPVPHYIYIFVKVFLNFKRIKHVVASCKLQHLFCFSTTFYNDL